MNLHQIHQTLTLYIIFQSLLFSLVLISKRASENKPLIVYFVYLFFFHVFFLSQDSGLLRICYEFIALCNTAIVLSFLYSILEKPMPKPLYLLWLLPPLQIISDYTFKTLDFAFYSAGFYENWYLSFPFYVKIAFAALLIWQIKIFKKEIAENSSSKKHRQLIKLYWGKYFVYFQFASTAFLLVYLLFTLTNGRLYSISSSVFVYSPEYYNIINMGCTSLFLLVFGYLALRNPLVFIVPSAGSHLEQQIAEIVLPEEEKIFQTKIELSDEQVKQYGLLLKQLMEEEEIYLDPELSLSKLAKRSQIPARRLSQFIQATSGKNFKEYINSYRIAHAQKLLTKQNVPNYTMYSIAFDSGFNAESSFYKIFKHQTGLTPKQYQDKFRSAGSI
jgi:AraC-like DNA-binding protein